MYGRRMKGNAAIGYALEQEEFESGLPFHLTQASDNN